jgi:hypothetical protein
MIPTYGLRHALVVAMINHLIWFLESAVDEDRDKRCHYSLGISIFTQGVIALREPITVVGVVRWEQTTEHCRAFSAITMQLLHDLGGILHRWILMPPVTCVSNCGSNEYVLVRPMTTMGKVANVITIYEEWLKESKVDLTTHLRRAGDTVPPILLNFPAHLLAHKLARGDDGGSNEQHTTRNDTRQGRAAAGTHLHTHPLQRPAGQAVPPPNELGRLLGKPSA